jgi:hypothetical protein
MRKIKELLLESKELEVFEVERLLAGFLKDKGIKAQVEKFDDYFNVYISSYAEDEGPKRIPVKKLLDYFKSLGVSEDASISKTKFGYTIVMINDDNSEKLMEAVEVDDEAGKCCICENIYHGLGNDPWPIYNSPEERCCNECKQEYVMPERNKLLRERVQKESEREDVSHAASNVVLDDKYIWLFNVLDVNGEDIEEGIEYLQDAIDVLIENQGTFLVAFPYVDPKPEDESVDIVFADNPGPIVIYNREQSTVAKEKLAKPSQETKPKNESVVVEAQAPTKKQKAVQGINDVFDYLRAYKGQLDNYEKLAKYCRILLKSINSITPQTESVQTESRYGDDYYLSIDFTRTFYADMTDASRDMGEQVIEYLQEQVVYLEEAYRIYLDFEYAGTTVEEYFSTPLTYEDAKLAQQALQGEYMDVTIKRYGDE